MWKALEVNLGILGASPSCRGMEQLWPLPWLGTPASPTSPCQPNILVVRRVRQGPPSPLRNLCLTAGPAGGRVSRASEAATFNISTV